MRLSDFEDEVLIQFAVLLATTVSAIPIARPLYRIHPNNTEQPFSRISRRIPNSLEDSVLPFAI